MAPNSSSVPQQENNSVGHPTDAEKRLEVLADGYYYDVTDFMSKHPGGNVIKFYTEKGEDASMAIQQFHHRSTNKVRGIMKSFKKRQAVSDADYLRVNFSEELNIKCKTNKPSIHTDFMDSSKLEKHRALTHDFTKLYLEIQKEGLFEPSYTHVILRILEIFAWFTMTIILCQTTNNIGLQILGVICGGVGSGRTGWLMHEGGHRSLTGKPKLDQFIQSFTLGLFVGLSGGWWNRGHNKHHAMPQRLNHDVDLETMPFLAYNAKVVRDPKQGQNFMIRNQAWLYLSIDCFLGVVAWKLYICPRNAWKRRDYVDLFFMALNWYFIYQYIALWQVLLAMWIGGNYMFGNFSLSHTHLPITEESTHWVQYGLIHTANIQSSLLVDWWMGYLNFQIEHHLFPTLPQFRCYLIQDRVRALAEKHGLPYQVYSYSEGWRITMKNFQDVARQLANPRPKEKQG